MSFSPLDIFFQQIDLNTLFVVQSRTTKGIPDWKTHKKEIADAFRNKVQGLYCHEGVSQIAIVKLARPVKNLRKCKRVLEESGSSIILTPLDEPLGIVVINGSEFDPEVIRCYMFTKQSGVGKKNDPEVNIRSGIVSVTFSNTEKILPKVLGRTHTVFETTNFLHMEPYFPSFHDVVADAMMDQKQEDTSSSSCSDSDSSDSDRHYLSEDGVSSSDDEDCDKKTMPRVKKYISQDLNETGFDDENSDEDVEKTFHTKRRQKKPVDDFSSCSGSSDNNTDKKEERNSHFFSDMRQAMGSRKKRGDSLKRDSSLSDDSSNDDYEEINLDMVCSGDVEKKILAAGMKAKSGQKIVKGFQEKHKCKIKIDFVKREIKSRMKQMSPIASNRRSTPVANTLPVTQWRPARQQPQVHLGMPMHPANLLGRFSIFYDDDDDDISFFRTRIMDRFSRMHCQSIPNPQPTPIKLPTSNQSPQRTVRCEKIDVNNVKITIKKGDASKEKADVLVNVVSTGMQFTESVISKAFAAAGGPTLQQGFDTAKAKYDGKGLVISGGGNLSCRFLYTLVLDNRKDDNSDKKFSQVLRHCFDQARKAGVSNIALPVIGCGRLLQYSPCVVADIFAKETMNAAQEKGTSFQNITIVAFEDAHFDEVQKALRNKKKSTEKNHKDRKEFEHRKEIIGCKVSVSSSTNELSRIKKHLQQTLKESFLASETIRIPNRHGFSNRLKGKIFEHAYKQGTIPMIMNIDERKGELYLQGEVTQVRNGCKDVKTLIESPWPSLVNTIRQPLCCTPDSWHYLAHDDVISPPYWKHYTKNSPLSVLSKSAGSERYAVVQVDKDIENAVKTLVRKTWKTEYVGHGKDAVNLQHRNIRVEKVERIENLDVFSKYASKRQEHFRLLSQEREKSLVQLDKLPFSNKGQVLTTEMLPDALKDDIFPEINECYVFHGTKPEIVRTVIHRGLDCRMCSDKGMFGSGIYCAESSTKADQYTDSKLNRTQGKKQMFLVRLLLGNMYVCKDPNPPKFRRPPCRYPRCHKDDCTSGHELFDSVVGDGQWLFREFVVYAAEQCYPEYIVTYSRE